MKKALLRGLRNGLALTVAGGMWYLTNDPKYIALAPVINAVCKLLRTKWGVKYLPM